MTAVRILDAECGECQEANLRSDGAEVWCHACDWVVPKPGVDRAYE